MQRCHHKQVDLQPTPLVGPPNSIGRDQAGSWLRQRRRQTRASVPAAAKMEKRRRKKEQSLGPLGHRDPRERRQYDQPTASFPRQLDQELGSPPPGSRSWHLPSLLRLSRHLSQQLFTAPNPGPHPHASGLAEVLPLFYTIG